MHCNIEIIGNKAYLTQMHCNIEIIGNKAYPTGDFPIEYIKRITSYRVKNYFFSSLYKKGLWDGRRNFFKNGSFPSGLVSSVVEKMKKDYPDCKISVVDRREDNPPFSANNGFDLIGIDFGVGVYDFQLKAAKEAVSKKRGILHLAVNSGKTEIACAITKNLSVPTLFIVPGIDLLYQSRDRFSKRLGISKDSIGLIGDGNFCIGDWITIGNIDSLRSKIDLKELNEKNLSHWDLLFLDECHGAGSKSAFTILDKIPAYWRFGMSATPLDRADGDTLRLISQTGEVIYKVSTKDLVERGISVQPVVRLLRVNQPKLPDKFNWAKVNKFGVVDNQYLNNLVVDTALEYSNDGNLCLVLVDQIKQGKTIFEKIQKETESVDFISGSTGSDERIKALDAFSKSIVKVLIATSILNQGIDVDCIDVIILAGGGKATIPVVQRIGRGLRRGRGRKNLLVIDIMNSCHKYLAKHSRKRLNLYKKEGCFLIETYKDEETSFTPKK